LLLCIILVICLVPAGMYANQVWGTEYIKKDTEFKSELQVCYMSSLKGTLGAKRATSWAVLRTWACAIAVLSV